ncbi:hypothetical protein FOH38_00695 [Lysinibacillus fusiformis]|nr:hypothetical protein FOH38_00695 [Lysinibacillus fusiformis]
MIIETERKCRICSEVKPLADFHKHAPSKNGRMTKCKTCRSKERYKNGAYLLERIRKHGYRHKAAIRYTEATLQDVLNATNCAYCDVELTRGSQITTEATIDHVFLGINIDENVIVCCRGCNAAKSNSHVYDFYQSSEKFTDEVWHEFVKQFASRLLKHEPTPAEIEAWKQGFADEASELRREGVS